MTILIIEDERKLVDLLKRALQEENYAVDTAYDGEEGLEKGMKGVYAAIVLDVNLPKKDGVIVCRELRNNHINTPIIMLTAKDAIEDRVAGLDAGADDYLVKPFGLHELFARIRAMTRRKKAPQPVTLAFRDIMLDTKKHEVRKRGEVIHLTPKEYKLLNAFFTHIGEALTRRQLLDYVWGPDFIEMNNELNVYIRYLRRKIDTVGQLSLIKTVRGVGFIMKE